MSDTRPRMFAFKNYAYAREDAAAFVASEGRIHGAQLERAWQDYLVSSEPGSRLEQDSFALEVLVGSAM
ncbi:DUF2388 domain-containing protein [Pseudomonas schmalbachii]|uniref:DUF2388 domain-containing protein n=1 Tax=Pseudomonas schmalbachii TaxID=2816993 RepID=A0ABS3TM22_9PSED|nr:DUF2388 domain-containing protein [Pseudomonas schmalbachii]MBO3274698.1 DUF2388 domain-containing protein [Pseudomonas schmalbachii]